ncbi:R3H and coiled-coil domain-containing protein 1 [Drosophila busckii]|uniref:R3H and coiled-coil domain-containing protein 1 n=1 Tax=Drosophila busckii TaxID=30019 RepID=UPI00083EDB77|nr:R3H and coiled-coil domain-containing protein 1 [Drosophila busckii]
MGVKKHISDTPLSKSNSVDLYRPPALRTNSSEEAATNETITTTTNHTEAITTTTSSSVYAADKQSPHREPQINGAAAASTRRERRPDRAVYVPRARRSQTTPPTTSTSTSTTATALLMPAPAPTEAAPMAATTCNLQSEPQALETPVVDASSLKPDDSNGQQTKPKKSKPRKERIKKTNGKPTEGATLLVIAPSETEADQEPLPPPDNNSDCDKEMMGGAQRQRNGASKQKLTAMRIEDVAAPNSAGATTATDDANKCDNEVRELQRASKEINRSNRRIMKQTFVSDVLEIPEKIETVPTAKTVGATAAATSITAGAAQLPPADSTTEDDDEEENEDDWENMFDESGDCLDPKILEELTESVGKCKIELPQMDYSLYHIKQSLLNEEEFPHVLEVSNFPVEFKTPDLLMLFSQYKSSGFDIKWVDDTHALAVFSSSRIAAEVLTMGHPFVKLKPLAEATLESRLKAKKAGAVSMQPYRQRPETCTAMARRLVSGALGVKLPTAPEERENERRVLRQAKERKLLAAKQRDEVWES